MREIHACSMFELLISPSTLVQGTYIHSNNHVNTLGRNIKP